MKIILITIFLFFTAKANAIQIITKCTSESGKSTFEIFLSTKDNGGLLDYKFMGQEVTYSAVIQPIKDNKILGKAKFYSSKTGETKGNPFDFILDLRKETFTELNKYNCE